jgi:hypothetical protein
MHELAVGVTTINMHGGPVLNPYNNTMHTGGSSGGAAAAVAMHMGAAGFCSDTGVNRAAVHISMLGAEAMSVASAADWLLHDELFAIYWAK